jgi:hypothetical protein
MSLKDRGAIYQRVILQIGHFGSKTGSFISSSFMVSSYRIGCENSMIYMPYIIMVGTCIDQKLFIMKA